MLIANYQRRIPGFDEKIVSMHARGMSVREIAGHVRELYGVDVSPDLISAVTDAMLEELAAWQARPLEAVYPLMTIVFPDAMVPRYRPESRAWAEVIPFYGCAEEVRRIIHTSNAVDFAHAR